MLHRDALLLLPSIVWRKVWLLSAMIACLQCATLGLSFTNTDSAEPRLNVLLIMVDDLRDFGGVFQPSVVQMPNLDRLRARGVTFERAYVQYTVCNPSRSSMLSGLRAEQTGIVNNTVRLREILPDIVTLPQLFKDNGWQAVSYGKIFHQGGGRNSSTKQLWSDVGRSWHQSTSFLPTERGRNILAGRNVTDGALTWCHWGAADGDDEDQPDGQIATATIRSIETFGSQPWFIGCGFQKPHDPFIAPKKYFDLYPMDTLQTWTDPIDQSPANLNNVGFGSFAAAFSKFGDREWRELLRAYLACTTYMDAQLGRVVDCLDRLKLWDRTIVVFVGDHGYHTGERHWWNKNTLHERSCRAPLVIAAPGMQQGVVSRSLVEFVDLYPTISDFAGLAMPHVGAGVTLRPILNAPAATVKSAAYTLVTRSGDLYGQSVRTERWRFTRWTDGSYELYDLEHDPEELRECSRENPAIISQLSVALAELPKLIRTK